MRKQTFLNALGWACLILGPVLLVLFAQAPGSASAGEPITGQAPPPKMLFVIAAQAPPLAGPCPCTAGDACSCGCSGGGACNCGPACTCGPRGAKAPAAKADPYTATKKATDGGPDWEWDCYRGVFCRTLPAVQMAPVYYPMPGSFQAPSWGYGGGFGGQVCVGSS